MSKVIDTSLIGDAIQCLEEFDYCFKLQPEEEVVYEKKGYLFPSLRPSNTFVLGMNFYFLFYKRSE